MSLLVFFGKGFKFQPDVSNGCPDVSMISMNLNNVATPNTHHIHWHCVIDRINKNEAVNLLHKTDLNEKMEHFKTPFFSIIYKTRVKNVW